MPSPEVGLVKYCVQPQLSRVHTVHGWIFTVPVKMLEEVDVSVSVKVMGASTEALDCTSTVIFSTLLPMVSRSASVTVTFTEPSTLNLSLETFIEPSDELRTEI